MGGGGLPTILLLIRARRGLPIISEVLLDQLFSLALQVFVAFCLFYRVALWPESIKLN